MRESNATNPKRTRKKRMAPLGHPRVLIVPVRRRYCGVQPDSGDYDVHKTPTKLHRTWFQREQSVVATAGNVVPGLERCTDLTNYNAAGLDGLATVRLDAAALCITVTPVPRRALSLFMCHAATPAVCLYSRRTGARAPTSLPSPVRYRLFAAMSMRVFRQEQHERVNCTKHPRTNRRGGDVWSYNNILSVASRYRITQRFLMSLGARNRRADFSPGMSY